MRFLLLALAAPILLAACNAADGPGTSGSPSPGGASPTPDASLPPLEAGPIPADVFALIVADAAARASVDPSALTVVAASAVTWNDGSIGCPEPGMMYTQALVDGYRVVLEADGQQYDYHVGRGTHFILCPPERSRDPIGDEF